MKTKQQYFDELYDEAKRKAEEREVKYRNDISIEASAWDYKELLEKYIKCRLSRISYGCSTPSHMIWKYVHDECRFCGLEYVEGKHNECCDDCWDKNKDKTLEELDDE